MKLSEVVGKYIALRDKKAKLKEKYVADAGEIDATLDKIEAKLLEVFETAGLDSVKTPFGTAYKSTRVNVSVADKDVFMDFCKTNGEWSLLEVRAAQTGVVQYKDAHDGVLPPGVNYRAESVVNVRRSS